jgi:hypothetical protein
VNREAKLAGFVILLAAIFMGAHVAGSHLGPVTTSHSQVSYTGQRGGGMGGMNMGGGGPGDDQEPAPAVRRRSGHS